MSENTNRQVRALAGEENLDKAIEFLETRVGFTGLTEQFDESLVLFRKWVNHDQFDIGYAPVNVAGKNEIRQQIISSESQFALIQESNQLDTRLYEYVKSEIYPRQQREFGPELAEETARFKRSLPGAGNASLKTLFGRMKKNILFRHRFNRLLS